MLYIIIGVLLGAVVVGGVYMLSTATDTSSSKNPTTNTDKIYPTITPTPQVSSGRTGLANPASIYCGQQGGTTVIQTNGSGGQYGLCDFGSGMMCEEWAMYRKECPIGGIRTTGYDNIQQKYCAWSGGQTLAVPNASCKLPGGTTCSVDAYYNGTCNNQ
jgi:putative hemolysin